MLLIVIALLTAQSSSARSTPAPLQATDQSGLATLERLDQIPMGMMDAVAVEGDRAYVGLGPRLAVVDLSVPESPSPIGFSEVIDDHVRDIAVDPREGDRVFVAAGSAGIWEADVANPADPRIRPLAGGSAHALRVEADRIFALGGALRVFARPAGSPPVARGRIEASIEAFDVAGDVLWLAIGEAGVASYDISDPARPRRIGSLDTSGHAYDVRVRAGRAYVVDGGRDLLVLDVSNPTTPRQVATFAIDISAETDCTPIYPACGFDARWLRIHGDRAVLGAHRKLGGFNINGEGRIVSIDLSKPDEPRELGQGQLDGYPTALATGAQYTLVAARYRWWEHGMGSCRLTRGGLHVFDTDLSRRAWLRISVGATDLALHDRHLYLADRSTEYRVERFSDPAEGDAFDGFPSIYGMDFGATETRGIVVDTLGPRLIRGIQTFEPFGAFAEAMGAGPTPIAIEDTDPGAANDPRVDHGCPPPYPDESFKRLATDGRLDYALDYAAGLQIFEPGRWHTPLARIEGVSALDLAARDGRVYLAESAGLRIVDAGDPDAPTDLGRLAIDGIGFPQAIAISEHVELAVLGGGSGLTIVDTRRAEAPVELASVQTPGPIVDVTLDGHTLYAASETGIQVLDLHDTTHPVERARVEGLREVQALAVEGDRMAVLAAGGVFLYEALPDDGSPPELPGPLYLPILQRDAGIHAPAPSPSVILQVADKGGPPSPPYFQQDIRKTPWFTLYSDGSYIRYPELEMHHPRTGRLDQDRLVAQIERFVGGGAFFDYPADDDIQRCQTDGSTTHVLLDWRGRRHRMRSYLMYWMGKNPQRCPPGSPSMPIGLETARFYALANEVAALDRPLAPNEHDAKLESATVYMDGDAIQTHRPIHPWPLERPMQDSAGRDRLSADELDDLARAIRRLRPWPTRPSPTSKTVTSTRPSGFASSRPAGAAIASSIEAVRTDPSKAVTPAGHSP